MTRTNFRRWGSLAIGTVLAAGVLVAAGGGRAGNVAAASDPTDDSITVTGIGLASGAPDTLTVDFTVRVRRATVQEALDAQSRFTHRLLAALKVDGVKDEDIRTTDLELFRYNNRKTHVQGYYASESVQAKLSPLDSAGKTISDAASSSGHVDVGGMSFDIANDDALVKQARENAFTDAKDRAQQYAGLSSRSLGRVEHITERVDVPEPVDYGYAAATSAGGAAAPVPIAAGQQTLTVRVTVIWQLT